MKYVFNILIFAVVVFVIIQSVGTIRQVEKAPEPLPQTISNFSGAKNVKTCRGGFVKPQSVALDETKSIIYVSNLDKNQNGGYICKVSLSGEIIDTLKTGLLQSPKGMAVKKNFLYIADSVSLIKYSLENDSVVKKYEIKGASFLNDVEISAEGTVYVSDSVKNCIFKFTNKNGDTAALFFQDTLLRGISGICAGDGGLVVASGKNIFKISHNGKTEKRLKLRFTPSGICQDGKGAFIVPALEGGIFAVSDSMSEVLLKNQNTFVAGGIEYLGRYNMLFAPSLKNNALEIYEIGQYFQNKE